MKLLINGLVIAASVLANAASAEVTLIVDGEEYTLSALMENCQSLSDNPVAQITCFNTVSKLVEEQSGQDPVDQVSVSDSLEAFRTVAQYQDAESGLLVGGSDCQIQILYYGNYFHLSRRNVSSIDLLSASFDASQMQSDSISEVRGAQLPVVQAEMNDGAKASIRGGVAIESAQYGFAPKSPRASVGEYAIEVTRQLDADESRRFDFVLVHPGRSDDTDDIWDAFDTLVGACK